MCLAGQTPAPPTTAAQAVAMVQAGLGWLATADAAALPAAVQAETLRGLERAESVHTAARSRVLAAFDAQGGYQDDGQCSPRTWLMWQTRTTRSAASGAVRWMRRLAAHPAVADALATGDLSQSWARQICDWTDALPEEVRADADTLLVGEAAGWACLEDLGALAEALRRHCARPDTDGDDGFADRWLALGTTFGGAGKLNGDLTPHCTASLQAVLESLGKRRGPEDLRTKGQRMHDALDEVCRRVIASGCLPDRAGQPTQIILHLDLDRLRGLPGASDAEAAWAGQATAGPGDDCDAQIVPVVTGRVDLQVLDRLAAALLHGTPAFPDHPGPAAPALPDQPAAPAFPDQPGPAAPATGSADAARRARAERAAREMILAAAADLLSGPGGLASYLRTRMTPGSGASVSLPLDIGTATDTIPAHLRRAVAVRDRGCRFPGCDQPAMACQPHHIIPRAQGGPTSLTNLILLCPFHHLIAVHRWGWSIALHPDGTVTATSPDGSKILQSHGPPPAAAA
jgi:hypothetical protein